MKGTDPGKDGDEKSGHFMQKSNQTSGQKDCVIGFL
jgi:hypothetical protein